MGNSGKPSVILRISHLIFINVLFIFSAIAIIIFYPQSESERNHYYNSLNTNLMIDADRVFAYLNDDIENTFHYPDSSGKIELYLTDKKNIKCLDYYFYDSIANGMQTRHLFGVHESDSKSDSALIKEFEPFLLYEESRAGRIYSRLESNGSLIYFFIKSEDFNAKSGLLFGIENNVAEYAQKSLAHILFVLFLISTLITLLIIYLVREGIEAPINRIIGGFEQVSMGQYVQLNPTGDRVITKLFDAFNSMTQKLHDNKRELKGVNSRLTNSAKTLAESEAILTTIFNYSPEAIIVADRSNNVILCNYQTEQDFGALPDQLIGLSILDLIGVEPFDLSDQVIEISAAAETKEVICSKLDNSKFPALLVRTPLGVIGERPMAALYFVKNISESSNYQEMILQLDRTATRGSMARDIAHEINNYLAILQGNLELIPMFLNSGKTDKVDGKLGVMRDTVGKITQFTEGLTRFSDDIPEYSLENLNQLILNLIAFLKPQNKYDKVDIITELSEDLTLVEIDPGQIQLLLVNLINNAADISDSESGQCLIEIRTELRNDGEILIEVLDNGPGVDPENEEQMFTKRFSTRREGTGLGLITCKNIVDNHYGNISYLRNEEDMTVFQIEMPKRRPKTVNPVKAECQ